MLHLKRTVLINALSIRNRTMIKKSNIAHRRLALIRLQLLQIHLTPPEPNVEKRKTAPKGAVPENRFAKARPMSITQPQTLPASD